MINDVIFSHKMGDTLFPVRCFTCGTVIGQFQNTYEQMIDQGYSPKDAMDALGIHHECCRANVLNPIQLPPNIQPQIEGYESFLAPQVVSGASNITLQPTEREPKEPQLMEDTNANRLFDAEEFNLEVERIFSAR